MYCNCTAIVIEMYCNVIVFNLTDICMTMSASYKQISLDNGRTGHSQYSPCTVKTDDKDITNLRPWYKRSKSVLYRICILLIYFPLFVIRFPHKTTVHTLEYSYRLKLLKSQ